MIADGRFGCKKVKGPERFAIGRGAHRTKERLEADRERAAPPTKVHATDKCDFGLRSRLSFS
jgi:hypothetical protein